MTTSQPQRLDAPAHLEPWARGLHLLLAGLALIAVLLQFQQTGLSPADSAEPDPGPAISIVRFFSYFTIESNLLVAASALVLGLNRPLTFPVRVLRADATAAIIITGIVHWFLLRPTNEETGYSAVLDSLLHIVVPLLAVLVWLVASPRSRGKGPRSLPLGVMLASLLFPVAYALWTFAHGAATGWYPYPFIDVIHIGLADALAMAGMVLLGFMIVVLAIELIDLARRGPSRPTSPGPAAPTG